MGIFGTTLRAMREAAEKSLRDLANAVGVSAVYISDVERGKRNPPQEDKLRKIADFLHIDFQNLEELAIRDRKRVELDIDDGRGPVSEAAFALARKWSTLTDEQAEEIIKICNKGVSNDYSDGAPRTTEKLYGN